MDVASPQRSLRALFVGDFSASSLGNQSVIEDLVGRLQAHDIAAITTSNRLRKLARVGDMLLSTWRHRRELDVASIDVFSGNAFIWAESVSYVLQRSGIPFVLVLRGGALPQFAARHRRRVARLLRSADRVITPSRYLGEQLRAYLPGYVVIPNPVDNGKYTYRQRDQATPNLVWLRAFHQIYNPTLAPRVVALVREQFPDVRLVMVGADKGDGTLAETRRVAAQLGVTEHIDFVGGVPKRDVPQRLAAGDILLNTPAIDNTPISVLEAMATGLCVVSTSVGGIPYLVQDGVHALLTPADDAQAMAAAVIRLVSEPQLAGALSRNGRRLAESFDWSVILPQWSALLREVAWRA